MFLSWSIGIVVLRPGVSHYIRKNTKETKCPPFVWDIKENRGPWSHNLLGRVLPWDRNTFHSAHLSGTFQVQLDLHETPDTKLTHRLLPLAWTHWDSPMVSIGEGDSAWWPRGLFWKTDIAQNPLDGKWTKCHLAYFMASLICHQIQEN